MSTRGEECLAREVPCRVVFKLSVKETELTKRDSAQHHDSGSHLFFSRDDTHSFPAVSAVLTTSAPLGCHHHASQNFWKVPCQKSKH